MSAKKILKRLIKGKKKKKMNFLKNPHFLLFSLEFLYFLISKHNIPSNTQDPTTPQYEIKSKYRVYSQKKISQYESEDSFS